MGIDVRIAKTPQELDDAFTVRVAVFVDEQGISRADELDDFDASATHCIAYDDAGSSCCGRPAAPLRRLRQDWPHGSTRIAPQERHRRCRPQRARAGGSVAGHPLIKLSAQLHARGFYERCGYTAHGDIYDDVGIPHIDMEKRLVRKQ